MKGKKHLVSVEVERFFTLGNLKHCWHEKCWLSSKAFHTLSSALPFFFSCGDCCVCGTNKPEGMNSFWISLLSVSCLEMSAALKAKWLSKSQLIVKMVLLAEALNNVQKYWILSHLSWNTTNDAFPNAVHNLFIRNHVSGENVKQISFVWWSP